MQKLFSCPPQGFLLAAIVIVYLAGLGAKLWRPDLDLEHLGEGEIIAGIFALLRVETGHQNGGDNG